MVEGKLYSCTLELSELQLTINQQKTWYGVLQFIPASAILWAATAISLAVGTYCKQSNSPRFAHIWITVLKAITMVVAIIHSLRFYKRNKPLLSKHGILLKLMTFKGVGPKCANLAVGITCGTPIVGVDIHMHRVTNRWGYVKAATPEKTMAALHEKLPDAYRVEINALLVPFGKRVCTGSRPHCATCPLLEMCQQVGVTSHG